MKILTHTLFVVTATVATISMTSCSSQMDDLAENHTTPEFAASPFSIGETRAAALSGKLLGLDTRGGETPVIEPVIETGHTRAASEISDTVAFIVNYPESNKFAVIANDTRVQPVLAFSKENTFDSKDEMVKTEFIDRISNYIGEQAAGANGDNPWIGSWDLIFNGDAKYSDLHGPYLKICIPQTNSSLKN